MDIPQSAPGRGESCGVQDAQNASSRSTEQEPSQAPDQKVDKSRKRIRPYHYIEDEHRRVNVRVEGFEWSKSPAWMALATQFGPRLSQEELISIAELVAGAAKIKLDRDARRRKRVMIKWFEEHWDILGPLLQFVVLKE